MSIERVEALAIRLPRARETAVGTAGSPTPLAQGGGRFRRSETVGALYSTDFETALVKVTSSSGMAGWGEAQAPLAPEVACTIVDLLLRPVLEGAEFDGSAESIARLWDSMYRTMRVRGQTGGFMLDAISGADIALWDLAGKMCGRSVGELAGAAARLPARQQRVAAPPAADSPGGVAMSGVPAYLSGLRGASPAERVEYARPFVARGFRTIKLFFDADADDLFATLGALRSAFPGIGVAVDALWRWQPSAALEFGRRLDEEGASWLEAPLAPEDPEAHAALARAVRTPIAIGESYRTCHELAPFFRAGAVAILQPDLGRTGITEGLRLAALAREHGVPVIPHVSIALGPQIAAAIHYATAVGSPLLEFNPSVFDTANRFLAVPLSCAGASYTVPDGPGLGIDLREASLRDSNI